MVKNAGKSSFSYNGKTVHYIDLVFYAVCDLSMNVYRPDEYPTQTAIVKKVTDYIKVKNIQSTVSRKLKELDDAGRIIRLGKRYAPNTIEYIRATAFPSMLSSITFGRPDVFVASRIKDDPSTATLIIDISDTNHDIAEERFEKYLGENGFWVVATDRFLQLMIIGTEEEVDNLCKSIKSLVKDCYDEQNPPQPMRLRKKKSKGKEISPTN